MPHDCPPALESHAQRITALLLAGERIGAAPSPGKGVFGFCANESAPFCSTCTRLRLASNGHLYGCLSNARHHDMRPVLDLPRPQALTRLRPLLIRALADKQRFGFNGEETVMKFIGG